MAIPLTGRLAELQFGAAPTSTYAAVSDMLENAAGRTTGHLIFATRQEPGDSPMAERARIDRFGNLGLGTPSPAGRLHVVDPVGTPLFLDFQPWTAAVAFRRGGLDLADISKPADGPLRFRSYANLSTLGSFHFEQPVSMGSATSPALGTQLHVGGHARVAGELAISRVDGNPQSGLIEAWEFYATRPPDVPGQPARPTKIADRNGCYYA